MKKETLTAKRARALFSYDAKTGVITRKIATTNSVKVGDVVGSLQENGYLRVRVAGVLYHVHRLAWLLHTGKWPRYTIDHRNGIRWDNRKRNLRDVPKAVNNQNRRSAGSITGYMGVAPSGEKFTAKIGVGHRQHYLGTYDTAKGASKAYLTAKRELHAGCTI